MKKILRFSLASFLIALAISSIGLAIYFLVVVFSKALQGWLLLIWINVFFWFVFSLLMAYFAYKALPSNKLEAVFQTEHLGSIGKLKVDVGGAFVIFCILLAILHFSVVGKIFEEIHTLRISQGTLKMENLSVQVELLDRNNQTLNKERTEDLIANHTIVSIMPQNFAAKRSKLIEIRVPVRENTINMLLPTSERFEKDFFNKFQINIEDTENNNLYTSGRAYGIDDFNVVGTSESIKSKRVGDADQDCENSRGTIHVNREENESWLDCFITLRNKSDT